MTSPGSKGIFSGTLAYLFNVFDGSETFSSIVRTARQKGYTEPDPRDDLSGMDVARKLIILGPRNGSHPGNGGRRGGVGWCPRRSMAAVWMSSWTGSPSSMPSWPMP